VLTIPIIAMRGIMTTLAADTTTFKAAICHLYSATVVVTPGILLSALTEATFTGYAASQTIAWNGPGSDEVGNAYLFGPQLTFISTGTTTTNTIYGAYLTGSGADSTTLLAVEPFATPIPIANTGDYVAYSPQVSLPGPNSSPVGGP
jgi:hypothetical protein